MMISHWGNPRIYREYAKQSNYDEGGIKGMIIRGYNHKGSGDIAYELEP